jgi:hypothetical protein
MPGVVILTPLLVRMLIRPLARQPKLVLTQEPTFEPNLGDLVRILNRDRAIFGQFWSAQKSDLAREVPGS